MDALLPPLSSCLGQENNFQPVFSSGLTFRLSLSYHVEAGPQRATRRSHRQPHWALVLSHSGSWRLRAEVQARAVKAVVPVWSRRPGAAGGREAGHCRPRCHTTVGVWRWPWLKGRPPVASVPDSVLPRGSLPPSPEVSLSSLGGNSGRAALSRNVDGKSLPRFRSNNRFYSLLITFLCYFNERLKAAGKGEGLSTSAQVSPGTRGSKTLVCASGLATFPAVTHRGRSG